MRQHIFEIVARAQFIIGVINLISTIILIVSAVVIFYMLYKKVTSLDKESCRQDRYNIFTNCILVGISTGCIVLFEAICLSVIGTALLQIYCPEYTAMESIIRMLGKLI